MTAPAPAVSPRTASRYSNRLARVLGLLLLTACLSPTIPEGTTRITPPAEYLVWRQQIQPCVAKPERRPFSRVEWYLSPEMLEDHNGTEGLALEEDGRIYLWEPFAMTPWVVQHELVHAIDGINDHPADPFYKCHLMASQNPAQPSTTTERM